MIFPKMDGNPDKRMTMVSMIFTSMSKGVGKSGLKFVSSEKVEEVLVDVSFHIIFELRQKFEYRHVDPRIQKEVIMKLKGMLFA